MNKLKAFIYRYVLSDALPLEAKAINVLYLCGMTFAFLAAIGRILTGTNPYVILVALGIILTAAGLMYICNRFRLYTACAWLTVILICDVLLPAAYFFLGGIESSAPAYFVLGMVVIFLVSDGKSFFIFLVTHIGLAFFCYYLSYRYPNLVIPPGNFITSGGLRIYLDHIQSLLVVGGSIGVVIKFQRKIYLMEKDKESLARRDIQRQDELLLAVNDATAMLFAPDIEQFEDSLNKSMDIIAHRTEVDRIFIWEVQMTGGTFYYKPIFQWANTPALQVPDNKGFPSFSMSSGSDYEDMFSRGISINSPISLFPPVMRDYFSPYGCRSVLAVPIFLQDRFWGFVSFDDCHRERHFPAQVESILKSSSLLIANAIIRNEMTQSLIQAKEEALASTRAKSNFLARMSHEIRTPLNAVLGLSEVELQGSLPERTRVNLEKIHYSGSHLLEIVNDILDISKIESGNFEIIPVEYELCGLINDVIQINIVRIGIKPIEFKLEIDETVPSKLYGDELRIKQILSNLLSNAFKYTEEGKVRLLIGWERREDAALLWFTVEDTGRGIKKKDLGKLFSEYTQFETTANRRIEGTGLGLSIAKGLAETMGGSVIAESEYGKGSVFRLQLPQRIVDEKPVGAEQAENLRNLHFSSDRNRGRGTNLIRSWMPYGKVLVADDLETNLDVMTGLLMPYGLGVDTVLSGREAIERIRAEEVRYDLVFMDHMMPEMDGIEAARIIRNGIGSRYAREVVIVALTANAVAGNREMFLENGFTDFISKPIDIYQLDMVLNRWIRDKQSEAVLKDAEKRNLERREADDGFNEGQLDAEGEWLLEHPLEGIDFATALKLYGNNGAAYLPILRSFVTHTPLLLKKMDLHLETSLPDYAIEAHGLKGTCSAIGAGGTAALGRELELAAKEGNSDLVRRKHGALRREALELTGRLKVLVEEWEGGQGEEEKEGRAEPERALLVRLSAAAAEFNSNAAEELLGELERYRYERGEGFIAWLREAAESFDYETIHKRLEEFLKGNHGIGNRSAD